jgi:DNA recombination protein RmuC
MDTAEKAYAEAMKKLYEGKVNLVRRAQNIKTVGARTTKTLDPKLVDRADA